MLKNLDLSKLTYHVTDEQNGKTITCVSTCKRRYNKGTAVFEQTCQKQNLDPNTDFVAVKEQVCKAVLHLEEGVLTISSWFTNKDYMNNGAGKATLKEAVCYVLEMYGEPEKIEYVWNGSNEYVLEWLQKFDGECNCPIAVQKTQADDDWDSHVYTLNKQKFLDYIMADKKQKK